MRKSRFNEDQMVMILREAETLSVEEVAKKHGISVQTIYNWRRRRSGVLEPAAVSGLKQLEQESARLEKLLAERLLELNVMRAPYAKKC